MRSEEQRHLEEVMSWLLPPPAQPVPCPMCGCAPGLVVTESLSWYECRKWWRFWRPLCHKGPAVLEGYEDGQYAQRSAARAWNKAAQRAASDA